MKDLLEILELVYELNDATLDKTGQTGPLIFESSGFSSGVTLCGEIVWDEDEFQPPFSEDGNTQMPLREWFNQRIVEIMEEKNLMAREMCVVLTKK